METGRVIQRRYLLQRLIEQGEYCAVYQGFDQVLQRSVAVKIPSTEQIPAYRAAIRTISHLTHPNIIGIYDLILEPEHLYLVQEYVDGDNVSALLQTQLSIYQAVDLGVQVCQALVFAGSASRKICHGDLTPRAVIRDRSGLVRVNNFALPSDMAYFTAWQPLGGDEQVVADQHLPWGQLTMGRRADDTRALGLLLYQLLSSRSSGLQPGSPPQDGRLYFMRNVPAELCEVVARTVIRQHPQHINVPEMLLAELKPLLEALEPEVPVEVATVLPQTEGVAQLAQASPVISGQLALAPSPDTAWHGVEYGGQAEPLVRAAAAPTAASPVSGSSVKLATARPPLYSGKAEARSRSINVPALLGIGIILFALFFAVGFFLAHNFLPLH